jgi:hypothetical protein
LAIIIAHEPVDKVGLIQARFLAVGGGHHGCGVPRLPCPQPHFGGKPWTLDITFDPSTLGSSLPWGSSSTLYKGAVTDTYFKIGGFTYTRSGGDIFTNCALPVGTCGTPLNSAGLVQFQWLGGWSGGTGAPNLNSGLGLLLASYKDLNALSGGLPAFPDPSLAQSVFSGLEWDGMLGGGGLVEQLTSGVKPTIPDPPAVPEERWRGRLEAGQRVEKVRRTRSP